MTRARINGKLFHACESGDIEAVRLFLEAGAEVNARDESERTPLQWACANGHTDIVRLLLEKGAEASIGNWAGKTPLDGVFSLPEDDPSREQILDLFRERAPELTLESALKLPPEDPLREKTLDWYREHHPEQVMETYCAQSQMP